MRTLIIATFVLFIVDLAGCARSANTMKLQAKIDELQAQVDAHKAERAATATHLAIFDKLDLVAFNNRDM